MFQYASDGCGFDTTSIIVTIHPEPIVNLIMSDEAVCSGLPITFSTEGEALDNYQWIFGSAGTANTEDPSMNFLVNGIEEIQLTANTQLHNCLVQLSETVEVFPLPEINYSLNSEIGCSPFLLNINNASIDASLFTWNLNDLTDNTSSPQFYLTQPGMYSLNVSALNQFGCEASLSEGVVFTLYDSPVAEFVANPSEANILTNPTVSFHSYTEGATSYEWDFGDDSGSLDFEPEHTYESAGTFMVVLTAENNEGCSDTFTQEVIVKDELSLFIPNSFTPNGDGLNDIFIPRVTGSNFSEYHFYVFDRWGNIVFESIEPNTGWIGDVSGGNYYSTSDLYTWRVEVLLDKGEGSKVFLGEVNVIR